MPHAASFPAIAALAVVSLALPAHAYTVRHPVFPAHLAADEVARLKAQVAPVMQFTPEKIDAFIVPRTTFYNISCPNCTGGTNQRYGWIWSVENPDRIQCRYCEMVFPNDRYPLDKVTVVRDPTGAAHEYRYYEGKDGYKHYLHMHVENCKKRYMEQQAQQLARLYAATQEGAYARQAARILNRLADAYPHYNVHGIEHWGDVTPPVIWEINPVATAPDGIQPVPGLAKDLQGYNQWPPLGKAAYPYCSTRRGDGVDNWFYDEMPPGLAQAYDLVAGSQEMDELSASLGKDVRRNIEEFFRATVNYVRTFPIFLGNMDPTLIGGLAVIGRVIGEPEFVHDALRRVKLILGWQFYPDGIWREASPSYHSQTIYGLLDRLEGPLKGYTDPDGYSNPEDGLHLTHLSGAADVPMLQESLDALNKMRLPNGQYLPIHDTWAQTTQGRPVSAVIDEPFQTSLMWAMGQAILGLGRGRAGVQAGLHFSGGYGHQHTDNLDLMLFGQGRELLSDVGYTHTLLHAFSVSSLAHNVLVVNQTEQRDADGHLLGWGMAGDTMRYCEAGAAGVYPGLVSVYRRAISVVALPKAGAYVVDVFRVKGGSRHDWQLHGGADDPQVLECSLPVGARTGSLLPPGVHLDRASITPGQRWRTAEGLNLLYGLFEDLKTALTDGAWSVTFRGTAPDSPALRTTVLGQPGTTVYCGTLPAIRPAREDNREVFNHRMPAVLARRQGTDLSSTFAAIHEPFHGAPAFAGVERLDLVEGGPDAAGIRCRGDGFTDYHLSGIDASSRMRAAGEPISATGRFAFVRTQNGRAVTMVLVDGSELRFGDRVLKAPSPVTGKVLGVRRIEAGDAEDALLVDAPIAPRAGEAEERVIVEFADSSTYGLAVREIRREGQHTLIALKHRPGFQLSGDGQRATQTHHPHHAMTGQPQFRLPTVALWSADGQR